MSRATILALAMALAGCSGGLLSADERYCYLLYPPADSGKYEVMFGPLITGPKLAQLNDTTEGKAQRAQCMVERASR